MNKRLSLTRYNLYLLFLLRMAKKFKSVLKQNKVSSENNVNNIYRADPTQSYYPGQALKMDDATGLVKPVSAVGDKVFGICETEMDATTLDPKFEVVVRQPRQYDTYKIVSDFKLTQAHVGDAFGIIPESGATGGYVVSASGTSKQFVLVTILSDNLGEFEFNKA